jgi:UDP-glucose 4-epimerase
MTNPVFERMLVTGGTGFIGRYLLDLLASGGCRPLVTTVDPFEPKVPGMDHITVDLTDAAATNDLIDNCKPRYVIHLAGTTGHNDPTGTICQRVNFDATVNLITSLNRIDVERFVMLGSAAEYGDQQIPFQEDMTPRPVSQYAISRARASEHALDMHAKNGFPVTVLRVFSAFGYGQPRNMFLSQLITHGLLNKTFMMSDGRQKRDFVYVKDVAAAIKASLTSDRANGRIINIGSGKGSPLKDVAQAVWNICAANSDNLEIGALDKTGDDAFDTEADISLAAEILDWRPTASLLDGSAASAELKETIRKMKENLRNPSEMSR